MKKAIFVVVSLFTLLLPISSQVREYNDIYFDDYIKIMFDGVHFRLDNRVGWGMAEHEEDGIKYPKYIAPEKNDFNILRVISKQPLIFQGDSNNYIFLEGDDIVIIYTDEWGLYKKRPWYIGYKKGSCIDIVEYYNEVNESSFLLGNNIEYRGKNVFKQRLDMPWVEGKNGNGIEEWIEFRLIGTLSNVDKEILANATGIYIVNGFISFDKPYLYTQNARIKRIKVVDMETRNEKEFVLKDTPNPQKVMLNEFSGHLIRVIIVDIYKGSKYEDACIGGVLLYK